MQTPFIDIHTHMPKLDDHLIQIVNLELEAPCPEQGYYSYEFIQQDGLTQRTMGSFCETENEYEVLVYYRQQGSRYDRLAGFSLMHNKRYAHCSLL